MADEVKVLHTGVNSVHTPMSMPSRICLICRKLEFPNAEVCTEIGWICPECAKRIMRMIYKGDDDG